MKSHADTVSLVAAALMLGACASNAPAPRPVVHTQIQQDESGFALLDTVRVGSDARADYDSAIRLLTQGQSGEGIALLQKLAQTVPDVTAPHVDLGIAYARAGDLDKAEASLKRALELSPGHPVAHNELGIVYRRKGEFAAARASYEQALATYPGFHFARLNLAILCDLYLADPACALDHYAAYQQAVPDDKQAAMWIADLRARAQK